MTPGRFGPNPTGAKYSACTTLFSTSAVSIGDGKRSFETVYRRVVITVSTRRKTQPVPSGTAPGPTIPEGPAET